MSILGNAAAGDPSVVDNSGVQPAPISGGIVSAAAPTAQVQTTAAPPQAAPTQQQPAQGGSRLSRIISAIANVADTALAGIPDKGRSTFVTGLGEGARAEKQQQQLQQEIKFRDLDSQIRIAQLHNQDLKMQQDTQAQRDAHVKAELDNRALANSLGIQYDTLASDGDAVMDHFKSQTAATGSASVPSGTHLSGDGESINIPKNDQSTQDGQKQMYAMLAPALGLSSLPTNAQFVPPQLMNMLTNKIHGYDIAGNPIKHDDLQTTIGTAQANRDQLAKNGATPQQLQAVDNMIGIYKANLNALDEHAESVRKQNKQSDLDVENSPANQAAAAKGAANKKQAELDVENSPANQAAAARGAAMKTDANQQTKTGGLWVPQATADEKKKAELAENMVYNINNVASILKRRPDIVGIVGGRYTSAQQLLGSNDSDIVALGTDIHNIGMANGGIHGMRSPQQAEDYANQVLNHFKNGPKGVYGGLKSSADSVQTFIDSARPETYKTHSKQGGAIRAMVPQGQQQ